MFGKTVIALACSATMVAAARHACLADDHPETRVPATAVADSESASIDEDLRFVPTTRPSLPEPQHPPLSNERNVDTNKAPGEWQRLTDDWFGLRPALDDRGISLQSSLTIDASKNFRGGADTAGSALRSLFNANLTLDTQRLLGWSGGTLFLSFQNQSGHSGQELAGSFQGISNIDADGRTQISELWYEQVLLDGKLRLKAGKIDASAEFAHSKNAGEFLNASAGFSPTILDMPAYPDPATGISVFVKPCEQYYAGVGIYDGSLLEGKPTCALGPRTFFRSGSSLFMIGEAGVNWTASNLGGRLGAGAWYHTGTFAQFDGGAREGAWGPYLVLDQAIWRKNPADKDDGRGIDVFLQYGYADASVSPVQHHVGVGLTWTGIVPNRDDDVLGLGASWVRFSDRRGANFDTDSELAVELFYKLKLTPWLSVKPDLQYVHNPGGVAARNDALVASVRLVVDF
ncbi:MAG: Carbohydrate-selective porin [Phycisphaerales bacterium]|nr:Carbohydrate-selective porin [Phycisphaerales bacterium]